MENIWFMNRFWLGAKMKKKTILQNSMRSDMQGNKPCIYTHSAKQEVQHAVFAKAGREKELWQSCDNGHECEVA